MASVSDTEDGWATIDEMPASDDELSKADSEESAPDLQYKVDALQEKTDLLQLQIKLKDDSIKALTDRLDALEAADRETRDCSKATGALQWQISFVQGDLDTQSKALKSSLDGLADSVKDLKDKARRLESEINERLECETTAHIENKSAVEEIECSVRNMRADLNSLQRQSEVSTDSIESLTNRVDGLQMDVEQVQDKSCRSLKWEMSCLADLKSQLESFKKEIDNRLDREANGAGAFQDEIKRLVQEHKEYVDNLRKEIERDRLIMQKALLGSNNECIKRQAEPREELKADAERVESENKIRMDNLERQNQALHDGLSHTRYLIEALRNGTNDALTQTYTDFSSLTHRVAVLEVSGQNTDSGCTIDTSTAENKLRNLESWVNGLQRNDYADPNSYYQAVNSYGINYGVFAPSYMNGFVQR